MARQRFIHPEIWDDPSFGRLPPLEQVLFVGCFSLADDEGRLLGDPAYLRSAVFKYQDFTTRKAQAIRDHLCEEMRNLVLYRVSEVDYLAFLKWSLFQKPKYPKPSRLPSPFLQDGVNLDPTLLQACSMGWVGLGRDGKGRAVPDSPNAAEANGSGTASAFKISETKATA